MRIDVLTLFPQVFEPFINTSILGRIQRQKRAKIYLHNLRDFGLGKYRAVDDKPYGGGIGMILKVDVVKSAIQKIEKEGKQKSYKILLDPKGKLFNQKKAESLSKKQRILLVCGHYEGVDARVESLVDESISIGDYVLTGGEAAAMVIVDAVTRLLLGALPKKQALNKESFKEFLLEYPQYTFPRVFDGSKVPEILLSGNLERIEKWQRRKQIILTKRLRSDLFQKFKNAQKD